MLEPWIIEQIRRREEEERRRQEQPRLEIPSRDERWKPDPSTEDEEERRGETTASATAASSSSTCRVTLPRFAGRGDRIRISSLSRLRERAGERASRLRQRSPERARQLLHAARAAVRVAGGDRRWRRCALLEVVQLLTAGGRRSTSAPGRRRCPWPREHVVAELVLGLVADLDACSVAPPLPFAVTVACGLARPFVFGD